MMAQSRAESTRDTYNYGQYMNQFPPNTIKVIREFKRIQKKICRHKMSIMFNEICIYVFIHTYTHTHTYIYTNICTHIFIHTHTHTHIYIYIYIYIYICTYTNTHTHTYSCTYTNTHTYLYTHTHTHTHTQDDSYHWEKIHLTSQVQVSEVRQMSKVNVQLSDQLSLTETKIPEGRELFYCRLECSIVHTWPSQFSI